MNNVELASHLDQGYAPLVDHFLVQSVQGHCNIHPAGRSWDTVSWPSIDELQPRSTLGKRRQLANPGPDINTHSLQKQFAG